MTIEKDKMVEAANYVMTEKGGRIVVAYSKKSLEILKYFELTIPEFRKGVLASKVLEKKVQEHYPEEYECAVKSTSAGLLKGRSPTKQENPVLDGIDEIILKQARDETKDRLGRLVSIYNHKITAVLRYFSKVTPRYSISHAAAILLEEGLKEIYPEFWKDED